MSRSSREHLPETEKECVPLEELPRQEEWWSEETAGEFGKLPREVVGYLLEFLSTEDQYAMSQVK